MPEPAWDYTFSVWPDESWGHPKALFDLFRLLPTRAEMTFTPPQWERFRSDLSHCGLSCRAVTRVPHREPEVIL